MARIILNDWYQKAYYHKGVMMEKFVSLELELEERISEYYFNNRESSSMPMSRKLKMVLLNRMTFESKRTAFKHLCELVDTKNAFKKTKNNSWPHSHIHNELRLLLDERNRFAHYAIIHPVYNRDDYAITLAELRDNSVLHYYTLQELNDIKARVSSVGWEMEKYAKIYRGKWDEQ